MRAVIEIDGRRSADRRPASRDAARSEIGMLFQNGALFDSLPVWENVAFGLIARRHMGDALAGPASGSRCSARSGSPPASGDLSPSELSGGMQKRVGPGARHRGQARDHVLRRADDRARPDHGRGDRRSDRRLRAAAGQHGGGDHPRHGERPADRRPGGDAASAGGSSGRGRRPNCSTVGNPVVDQFTHGRREGPIQMELRR